METNGKAPSMTMLGLGGDSTPTTNASTFSITNFLSFGSSNSGLLNRLFTTTNATTNEATEAARIQLSTLWTSARPWKEFFNTRKMVPPNATELRERLMDNLPYFFPNYLLIFIALSSFGVLVHPLSFIALLVLVVMYVVLFMQGGGSFKLGPVVLNQQAKIVVFVILAAGLLYLTNAIAILGSWAAFSVILSMAHAGARISAKEPDFETPADQV